MTIGTAPGYGNLPQGNWVSEIFSGDAQIAFRENSVIQHITNTDYFGQISQKGDTVRILKEPNITVSPYVRGQEIISQPLDDDEITMTVDMSNYGAFDMDDIEDAQAHIDWQSLASNRMGFELANAMDVEVLTYMADQVGTAVNGGDTDYSSMKIGAAGSPIDLVLSGKNDVTSFSALSLLNRFDRLLNERNVPKEDRWFVGDPFFFERLGDEDSKFLDADYVSTTGRLEMGHMYKGKARGFMMYESNNLPKVGNGPAGTDDTDHGVILAGHYSAVATVEQLNLTETLRSQSGFADIVRSLHLYGRHILREEALVGAFYHSPA